MVVAAVRELGPRRLVLADWIAAHPVGAVACALGPFAVLIAVQVLAGWLCSRRLDRRGGSRGGSRGVGGAIGAFERVSARVRVATLPLQVSAVMVFGWLDMVRGWVGDVVAVDEVLSVLPAVAVLLVSWASAEPVERRVREALLIRRLDEGLAVPPMPSAWTWWWGTVKGQLLFAALPVVSILSWSEAVGFVRAGLWERADAVGGWAASPPGWSAMAPGWMLDRAVIAYGSAGLQLAGVVGLLALMPIALRYLWDTVPLGAGAMREGLLGLCAQYRVRVRGILVWRTHGAMVNGAVVGFLPRLRYIVLTDTLLESLPWSQVEAVAAHEVAHVRHRHIVWLAGSMVATGIFVGSLVTLAARGVGVGPVTEGGGVGGVGVGVGGWGPVGVLVVVFGVGLMVFGWASRRFEWQADVFAAQHLSRGEEGETHGSESRATESRATVTAHGAGAMSEALLSVSMINGFPSDRFTFRHGSIDGRRQRLMEAVGEPLTGGKADRAARQVKLIVLALGVVGVGLAVVETIMEL